MYIDQISVFVENKKGRLAGIMEVLNKAGNDYCGYGGLRHTAYDSR